MHLTEIYDQYYQRVRKFILHTVRNDWVADDLVQETFIKVNNNLENLKDAAKLQAWIFRIAHNICQDYFRQQGKTANLGLEEISEETVPSKPPTTQKELEQGQMRQMCLRPGQPSARIAPQRHHPVGHQRVQPAGDRRDSGNHRGKRQDQAHRARKKLKALLEEHCVFEVDERNVLTCQPETPSGYNLFLKPSALKALNSQPSACLARHPDSISCIL